MNATDHLTAAVARWVNEVLPMVPPAHVDAMLAGCCDFGIQVMLREGTIKLVAIDPGGWVAELVTEHVAPLRASDGFGDIDRLLN